MSPKSFLHKLGIRPLRNKAFSPRFQKAIEAREREHTSARSDVMSAQVIDLFFEDEEIALETLGGNFDRLANSMARISSSRAFQRDRLKRVCDLGGGTGIIGLWLATTGKCDFCEVIDHAENPLRLGRKWGALLSLANVNFRNASYSQLPATSSHDFDFVFAEHAVDLNYPEENDDLRNAPSQGSVSPGLQNYKDLAASFSSLLKSEGLGLIGGGWTSLASLRLLCLALRERHLFIDWKLSNNEDGLQLYIRPGTDFLLNTPKEEALAIIADAVPKENISVAHALSLETIFQEGVKYVEVCSEENTVTYKCSVFQRGGLACLFQKSSRGPEGATLFSAAKMHVWAKNILLDAQKRQINSKFIDPRLSSLLDS